MRNYYPKMKDGIYSRIARDFYTLGRATANLEKEREGIDRDAQFTAQQMLTLQQMQQNFMQMYNEMLKAVQSLKPQPNLPREVGMPGGLPPLPLGGATEPAPLGLPNEVNPPTPPQPTPQLPPQVEPQAQAGVELPMVGGSPQAQMPSMENSDLFSTIQRIIGGLD